MRLFLAIYPPQEFRDYFRDVIREFDKQKRNLRTVEPEQLHMTLRFIGSNVNEASKQIIAKELSKRTGSYPQPAVELEKLNLGFPRQQYPRVLFSSVKRTQELDDLVDSVHRIIRGSKREDTIQWKRDEDRQFHFTIGRLKDAAVNRSTIRKMKTILEDIEIPHPEAFTVKEMYLVKSEVQKGKKPKHTPLERITL